MLHKCDSECKIHVVLFRTSPPDPTGALPQDPAGVRKVGRVEVYIIDVEF